MSVTISPRLPGHDPRIRRQARSGRHEQGGSGPMPRHIPDRNPKSAPCELLCGQEIEVVTAHGIARNHPARHFEAGQGQRGPGQQAPLDLGGHGQRLAQDLILSGQGSTGQVQFQVRGHSCPHDGRPDRLGDVVDGA
jgi:hypothetical protein